MRVASKTRDHSIAAHSAFGLQGLTIFNASIPKKGCCFQVEKSGNVAATALLAAKAVATIVVGSTNAIATRMVQED